MNPSDVIFGALIGVGGAVIGALLAGILSHWNAIKAIRITEFNKAAAVFRAAFVNEILSLRENVKTNSRKPTDIITRDVLVTHEKAKIIFEPFVPTGDLERFNETWNKYKETNDRAPDNMTITYMKSQISKAYLEHTDDLLEFAKPRI